MVNETKMKEAAKQNKIIKVIGIGNSLYQDEGVGVHVIPFLEEAIPDSLGIEIVEGTTDGIRLLTPVEDADYLIIVDAINAGKEPGTLITVTGEEIPKYFGVKMSVHQVGIQEVLSAAKLRDRLPEEMVMFGIQPQTISLGLELTDVVQSQVPQLVQMVVEQIKLWSEKM